MSKKQKESIDKYSDKGLADELNKQAFKDEETVEEAPAHSLTIAKFNDGNYGIGLTGFEKPSQVLACLDYAKKQLALCLNKGTFNGEGVL